MHNRMLIIIAVSAAMGLFSERASAAFYQEDFNSGFNVGDVLIDVTDWGQMPGGGDSDAIVICGSCGIGGSPGLERRTLDQDYEHIRLSISPPSGSYYEVRALISLPPGNVSVGLYNNRVDGNTSTGAQIDFSGNADFGVRFVAGSPEYNSPVDLSRDGPFGDWFEGRVQKRLQPGDQRLRALQSHRLRPPQRNEDPFPALLFRHCRLRKRWRATSRKSC